MSGSSASSTSLATSKVPARTSEPRGWRVTTPLKPHQVEGVQFLQRRESTAGDRKGALVGDVMGLGKTLQFVAHCVREYARAAAGADARGVAPRPTLCVLPKTLLSRWRQEIREHTNLADKCVYIHHGSATRKNDIPPADAAFVLVTYGFVQGAAKVRSRIAWASWRRRDRCARCACRHARRNF